jgi:hypothetical protein
MVEGLAAPVLLIVEKTPRAWEGMAAGHGKDTNSSSFSEAKGQPVSVTGLVVN